MRMLANLSFAQILMLAAAAALIAVGLSLAFGTDTVVGWIEWLAVQLTEGDGKADALPQ